MPSSILPDEFDRMRRDRRPMSRENKGLLESVIDKSNPISSLPSLEPSEKSSSFLPMLLTESSYRDKLRPRKHEMLREAASKPKENDKKVTFADKVKQKDFCKDDAPSAVKGLQQYTESLKGPSQRSL